MPGFALDWRKSWRFRARGRGGFFVDVGAVIPSRNREEIPMRPHPVPSPADGESDLFRNRLDSLIDMRHASCAFR